MTIDEVSVAFPYSTLARERVVNHAIGGTDVVVFYEPETLTPFKDSDADVGCQVGGRCGSLLAPLERPKAHLQVQRRRNS